MLQKLKFKPGFNKQDTDSGAEGQWTDGDFVRFRYGLPEKIGGWLQLTSAQKTLPGAARAQVAFSSFACEKYSNQEFVLSPLKVPISNMLIGSSLCF